MVSNTYFCPVQRCLAADSSLMTETAVPPAFCKSTRFHPHSLTDCILLQSVFTTTFLLPSFLCNTSHYLRWHPHLKPHHQQNIDLSKLSFFLKSTFFNIWTILDLLEILLLPGSFCLWSPPDPCICSIWVEFPAELLLRFNCWCVDAAVRRCLNNPCSSLPLPLFDSCGCL